MCTLVAVVNLLHVLVALFVALGSAVLHVAYMPAVIGVGSAVLSRYHDYCWMTRAVEVFKEEHRAARDTALDFAGALGLDGAEAWIARNRPLYATVATLVVACNISYALYRLSRHHGFSLLPGARSRAVAGGMLLLWVACELAFYLLDDAAAPAPLSAAPALFSASTADGFEVSVYS
jgi:hypothetical protein